MTPTPGRIVNYMLLPVDVSRINKRRDDFAKWRHHPDYYDTGFVSHWGTKVHPGEVYPMVITRVHDDGLINGQVLLDGNDAFWAVRISEGRGPGTWSWPVKV